MLAKQVKWPPHALKRSSINHPTWTTALDNVEFHHAYSVIHGSPRALTDDEYAAARIAARIIDEIRTTREVPAPCCPGGSVEAQHRVINADGGVEQPCVTLRRMAFAAYVGITYECVGCRAQNDVRGYVIGGSGLGVARLDEPELMLRVSNDLVTSTWLDDPRGILPINDVMDSLGETASVVARIKRLARQFPPRYYAQGA